MPRISKQEMLVHENKTEQLEDPGNQPGVLRGSLIKNTSPLDSHTQNVRMECLKIAVTLLEDYIKENTLSPRDESMAILWEVADKCVDYCTVDNTKT